MAGKRILVTGAGGSPGLNFLNSLRDASTPYELYAADCNRYHLQWPDVTRRFLVPPCDHPEYIGLLNEIIDEYEIDFVHPQPDVEVRRISEARDDLHATTLLPSAKTIRTLQDKAETGHRWEAAGLRHSPTIELCSYLDLLEARERLGMPFWVRATTGAGARGSTLAENLDTASHWLGYWHARGCDWTFIAEKYLPGRDYAWQSLWKDGELITSQGRERLEYIYPHLAPSGRTGTPIVARTVNDPRINEIATACVKAIDPQATGVFSVDLREDAEGRPIPTEINAGRFFTTSYFMTCAGLNFADLYIKLAFGEEIPKVAQYNPLAEGLYWIRHIDCPTVLATEEDLHCLNQPSPKPSLRIAA